MKRPGSILLCVVTFSSAALAFAQGDSPAPAAAATPIPYTAKELMVLDPLFKEAYENCKFVATVGKEKTEDCHHFLEGHGRPNGMKLPAQATDKMDVLREQIAEVWPEMKYPSVFAAQIEQESCISLKHSKCWNSKSELKTDREYGFGLGQITVKYKNTGEACTVDADCAKHATKTADAVCRSGSKKSPATCMVETMNVFKEMKRLDAKLALWDWSDRHDARFQMRSVVLHNKGNWKRLDFGANDVEKLAFMLSAYNGGMLHVLKDRKLCMAKKDCDPERWFGHVETDSVKAKRALKGYGKSFFEINREYPVHVLFTRRPKYMVHTDGPLPTPVPTVAPAAQVKLAEVKKRAPLPFPPAAAMAKMNNEEVILEVTIKEDGTVGKVKKKKGSDIFVDAAKSAIKKNWEFTPGTRDGQPVESTIELTLLFQR